jgi:hypothetical protein
MEWWRYQLSEGYWASFFRAATKDGRSMLYEQLDAIYHLYIYLTNWTTSNIWTITWHLLLTRGTSTQTSSYFLLVSLLSRYCRY